ncbi:membrane-spanning 4-domains subfamily A member 18 isoform X1 [Meriones unguiculatus]|uniref:membrane-spanning 4-domains subfamily A member 18 isoform X1 n=1 Tax=Meriones unguiculatus TaxID=10047 RepID=UPI00293F71F7|nr:membrane-spanning 4-domains subfamily A member 18 isoform X1 [Meriones unguiculatus]XP_060242730.1 membrane-spanning 4-domains subfamily A member 18 isoform X1 [Meriones unguiculatus]
MSKQEHVSVTVPGNVHVTQPSYATVSGSQEKPLEKTTYPTSATVLPYNPGSANLQSPHIVIQNPAGMTDLQAQPAGLQYPAEMAGVQTPPGGTQYSPEITSVQILPGDPQNPLNTVPGQTQTSSHPQWNLSFVTFPEFNPKKFINEEVRTLGAIQILIGLFHIFSAVNPQLYKAPTVLGASAYLIWGGLSFIISGSLSVCAEKSASSCMVNGSIGMNVVSSILSVFGIIIIIIDLCISLSSGPTAEEVRIATKAISGGLLPFVLLEFILTCVVSHFGCQAVCWTHFENMTAISSMFGGNTVNTTAGPVITTSPDNATNIPVQPTLPSHVPPEHTYQTVTPQK